MNNQFERMQKLAGLITEGVGAYEYEEGKKAGEKIEKKKMKQELKDVYEKINAKMKELDMEAKLLNENFEKWEDGVSHKIHPINLPYFDEIIYLESIKDPNVKYFESVKTGGSNYLWSIKNFSDFYDRETAEIVYEKHKNYFEVFNYDFYSYLDFYDPIEKVHALHGKQTNIFHI